MFELNYKPTGIVQAVDVKKKPGKFPGFSLYG